MSQLVAALGARRRLAHLLNGGQQKADENGDDGDYHQQFDQRETRMLRYPAIFRVDVVQLRHLEAPSPGWGGELARAAARVAPPSIACATH